VRTYSKGNRQKLGILAALMTRADLLVMDEPTSGLDPLMEQAFRLSINEAKANGQTVFLSSHILAEVEALCDRLAILRRGKLVELGTLEQMRHLSAVTVEATFDKQPPEVGGIQSVSAVNVAGRQLTCQVRGEIAPLLAVLSAARPRTLLIREPSLEELFLTLYGDDKVAGRATVAIETIAAPGEQPIQEFRSPGTVIARFVARSVSKTAAIVGYGFAIYVVSSIYGFHQRPTRPRPHARRSRNSLATTAGLQALFGVARHIDTVRGFTAWRTLGVLTIVGGHLGARGRDQAVPWRGGAGEMGALPLGPDDFAGGRAQQLGGPQCRALNNLRARRDRDRHHRKRESSALRRQRDPLLRRRPGSEHGGLHGGGGVGQPDNAPRAGGRWGSRRHCSVWLSC